MQHWVLRVSATGVVLASIAVFALDAAFNDAMPQEPGRGDTVADRSRPELDPLGLRLGQFLLFPKLTVEEKYIDNIFFADTGKIDDFVTVVAPSFAFESDWNNHELKVFGDAGIGRHMDEGNEDYEDFTIGTEGRLDISRVSFLAANITYSDFHEERGSPDDVNGLVPTTFTVFLPQVQYLRKFGRFSLTADGTFTRLDFDDVPTSLGTTINNDDRDRNEWDGSLRLGYEFIPGYEAFVRGSYDLRNYDDPLDDNGFDRDSEGFEVVAGTAFELTGVTSGNVFGGYRTQDLEDSALSTIEGFQVGADITWNVTPLTTIKGLVNRTVEETTIDGAAGFFATRMIASIDHELLRNLLLGATANYTINDYEDIDRNDNDTAASIFARYLINRNFYVTARYDLMNRDSNVTAEDYLRNVFSIRVEAQW